MSFPLERSDPASLGFAHRPLAQLDRLINRHIEEGRYPGAQIALARHGKLALFRTYGRARRVRAAVWPALGYGCFKDAPGLFVLMRDLDSEKPYDLGLFTLDTALPAAGVIERYSWRWPIEPSNATGKQVTGAGDACSRTLRAVERAVPFGFLVQSLMICWYAISCDPAAGMEQRRRRSPWYLSKTTPSAAGMRAALRDALTEARINAIGPGGGESRKSTTGTLTSETRAA